MKVAVVKENTPDERRVALVPETVPKLTAAGAEVLVENGAGEAAWFPDSVYAEAGAVIVTAAELFTKADVILTVTRPAPAAIARMRAGQTVVGMLSTLTNPELARDLAAQGVTAVSLDGLPRTLSRAQPMDALSSQANVAGYKAVLVAASAYGRFFPLLITAAGTARPPSCSSSGRAWPGCRPSEPRAVWARWLAGTTCGRPPRAKWNPWARRSSS